MDDRLDNEPLVGMRGDNASWMLVSSLNAILDSIYIPYTYSVSLKI